MKRDNRRNKKYASCILALLLILLTVCITGGCGKSDESQFQTLDDFKHATIGVQTGTTHEARARELFPDAEIKNYTTVADLVLSLQQGKIDGFIKNDFFVPVAQRDLDWIDCIPESMEDIETGVVFNKSEKGEALKEQMDALIDTLKADGTLQAMEELWFGEEEPDVTLDYSDLTGENGTIRYVLCAEQKPFAYMKDGQYIGYDVELVVRFCREYGYGLQIENAAFSSLVPGVVSDKYDLAASGVTITEERAESVLFSEPDYEGGVVMVIKGQGSEQGFLSSLGESFQKTFIRENRWELFVEGIGITLLITVVAAVGGTVLGFGLYMLSRGGNKIVLAVGAVYTRIIAGLPAVVLLMILFFVVFGSSSIDGVWVASIGFALITGSFVYKNMGLSVKGVDYGQTEAALALGYTDRHAFFRIVLPQAMRQFMPAYQGEMVSLLKSTAIVGYVAVEDLTKVSDIIRSNTYEAFFPLIATAVIYFILTWVIAILIGRIDLKFDWKRRDKASILKGVKL